MQNSMEEPNVSRLHFLVHPGTCGNAALWQRYWTKASSLEDDEVMLAFTRGQHGSHHNTAPAHDIHLRELRDILDERLIVISGAHVTKRIRGTQNGVFQTARELLAARGLHYASTVPSEAYGETLGAAVPQAAHNAHKGLGLDLRSQTVIRAALTDWLGYDEYPVDLRQYENKRRIRMSFDDDPSTSDGWHPRVHLSEAQKNPEPSEPARTAA